MDFSEPVIWKVVKGLERGPHFLSSYQILRKKSYMSVYARKVTHALCDLQRFLQCHGLGHG